MYRRFSSRVAQLFFIFKTIGFATLIGCATPFYVDEIEGSLVDIQKVASENIPGGLGFVSENKRNLYSKEYIVTEGKLKSPIITKVSILGDRRPYALQIQVRIAARTTNIEQAFDNGSRYEREEFLAERTYQKIKEALNKRRNQKNLFDDFKPF